MAKKHDLIQRAKERVRKPAPRRLDLDRNAKAGYRIMAVSLYTPEADWIEQTAKSLKTAGNGKASRSLVVREAVLRLQDDLKDKDPTQLLQDFTRSQAKRTLGE